MATRVKCCECDNLILETTAKRNNGLCRSCRNRHERAEFESIVDGWIRNPETLPGTNEIPEPDDLALALRAHQLRAAMYPDEEAIMEGFCHKLFGEAHDKWCQSGSSSLTVKERHTLAIETFYGEVTNGGLLQYLGNESGAFSNWSVEAFEVIGLPEYADVMRTVKGLFPEDCIPEDLDERSKFVERIDRDALETIEEEFWSRYSSNEIEIRRKLYKYLNG